MTFIRSSITAVPLLAAIALAAPPAATAAGAVSRLAPGPEDLARNPDIAETLTRLEASPKDPALLTELGNRYAALGWEDLAVRAFRAALEEDPDLYITWTNLGTVYNRMGNLGRAENAFRRAVRIQPRAALAHYNLGVVLDRTGRYEKALESYKTAVTYDPTLLDPAVNPQVVNNEHLVAIQLLRYGEEIGASTLPLEPAQTPAADAGGRPASSSSSSSAPADAGPVSADGAAPPAAAPGRPAPQAAPPAAAPESAVAEPGGKPILGTLKMHRKSRRERRRPAAADATDAVAGSRPSSDASDEPPQRRP